MADIAVTNIRPGTFAIVRKYQASAALEVGEAVELLATGKIRKTPDDEAGFMGIVVASDDGDLAVAADEWCSVVTFGYTTGFSDLAPIGQLFYLSATAGNIADAAADGNSVPCGYIADAETLFVLPVLANVPSS